MPRLGYLIVARGPLMLGDIAYQGVDRPRFPESFDDKLWTEAQRLWDEAAGDLDWVADRGAALRIARMLEAAGGLFDVLQVSEAGAAAEGDGLLLGFDTAQPGGDFFSAVRNGLATPQRRRESAKQVRRLNSAGLFSSSREADAFISHYRSQPGAEEGELAALRVRLLATAS